jgi:hypothetical protein
MGRIAEPSRAEAELAKGSVFAGRYKIKVLLGEGDRKRTYLAEDKLLGRVVALSVIKPAAAQADPEGTGREVKALVQAGNHDSIVTLYDRGSAEGAEYLVFEYLSYGTLRDYLAKCAKRGKPMPVEDVMQLGRQLARALSHMHRHGLIHRDVAPANVWLDQRRVAHLGDFDSAISLADPQVPGSLPLTTEGYAAPEELAGQRVDERSDLYSLGAVLYEVLTGERPALVPGGGVAKRLAALRPDIPHRLSRTICGLLAVSPDDRPARADDVLKALRQTHSTTPDLLTWAETLPFPLASILWHYDAEPEPGTKVDYLLKFFEALAQLMATIQLSAYMSDPAFFGAHKAAWFGAGMQRRKPIDLRRASFGAWVELSERLAGTGRELLADNDGGSNVYLQLFAASDPALPEILASWDLTKLLLQARDCRNAWSGHGGMPGLQIQRERLHELASLLAQTQHLFGWSFETWTLLRPMVMTYSRGVFDLTAAILTGTNPTFRKKQVQLAQPLEASRLHLLNDNSPQALELIPLIRVIAGNKTGEDACYFYNRLEGDEVRWVSYHFHADPELILPDDDVTELVIRLLPCEEPQDDGPAPPTVVLSRGTQPS